MRVYCKPSQPSCLECWLVGQSGATMLKPPLFQYWTLRNPIDHSISQFSEIDDWGCRIFMPGRIKQHDDKYNCNMMKCGMECGVCICLHKKKFIQYFYKISGSAFMVLRHRRAHSAYTFFTSPWIGTQEPRMRLASALKKLEWRRPLWLDLPRQLLCHHDAPAIHGTTATQLLSLTPDREYETILCRHNELKTTLLP